MYFCFFYYLIVLIVLLINVWGVDVEEWPNFIFLAPSFYLRSNACGTRLRVFCFDVKRPSRGKLVWILSGMKCQFVLRLWQFCEMGLDVFNAASFQPLDAHVWLLWPCGPFKLGFDHFHFPPSLWSRHFLLPSLFVLVPNNFYDKVSCWLIFSFQSVLAEGVREWAGLWSIGETEHGPKSRHPSVILSLLPHKVLNLHLNQICLWYNCNLWALRSWKTMSDFFGVNSELSNSYLLFHRLRFHQSKLHIQAILCNFLKANYHFLCIETPIFNVNLTKDH